MESFAYLESLYLELASKKQPKKWTQREFVNAAKEVLKPLDAYHCETSHVIFETKAAYQQLSKGMEKAQTNIQEQQQAIIHFGQTLKDNEAAYSMAVIKGDENTIRRLEQNNADISRKIKFAEIRIKANQAAITNAKRYIYLVDHMMQFLETNERNRAHTQAELDFNPKLQAFLGDFKSYIQNRREIGNGYSINGGFNEDETVDSLIQQIKRSLKQ